MAVLTAAKRRQIPKSEWGISTGPRSNWAYPMPSKATARKIGISEGQRQRILRNAAARSAQRHTRGTHGRIAPKARRRSGPGPGWNASHHATRAGSRRGARRRRR